MVVILAVFLFRLINPRTAPPNPTHANLYYLQKLWGFHVLQHYNDIDYAVPFLQSS